MNLRESLNARLRRWDRLKRLSLKNDGEYSILRGPSGQGRKSTVYQHQGFLQSRMVLVALYFDLVLMLTSLSQVVSCLQAQPVISVRPPGLF